MELARGDCGPAVGGSKSISFPVKDGAHERYLAAWTTAAQIFGEFVRFALSVATAHFQALPLSGQAGTTALSRDDQRRRGDGPIEFASPTAELT
jgi:hypothetical protein